MEIFITAGAILSALFVFIFFEVSLNFAPTLNADNCKSHILSGFCHAKEYDP